MTLTTGHIRGAFLEVGDIAFCRRFLRVATWRQKAMSSVVERDVIEISDVFQQGLRLATLATKPNVVENTCGDMATFAFRHVACRRLAKLGALVASTGHACRGLPSTFAKALSARPLRAPRCEHGNGSDMSIQIGNTQKRQRISGHARQGSQWKVTYGTQKPKGRSTVWLPL